MSGSMVGAAILALLAVSPSPATGQVPDSEGAEFALAGPSFIAVRVDDINVASDWYAMVFDLVEANRIDAEDGRFSIRILAGEGLGVELIQQRDSEQPPERHLGLFKAGVYVTNIGAFHSHLQGLAVDVDAQTFVDSALNARSFVFRDPEGNRIQAFQNCGCGC